MANVVPQDRGVFEPSCPHCGTNLKTMYSVPQKNPSGGFSGHYTDMGDCRNCGPVWLGDHNTSKGKGWGFE